MKVLLFTLALYAANQLVFIMHGESLKPAPSLEELIAYYDN